MTRYGPCLNFLMAMSGVTVEDEVSKVYNNMKMSNTIEYMILIIGDSKQDNTRQDQTSSKNREGNKTVQIAKKGAIDDSTS